MSVPILPGSDGWPSLLLERAAAPVEADALPEGAWEAFRSAVASLTPDGVIRLVSEAGLAGRGGGAFPTGRKWRIAAGQSERRRHVVANGFEADPGARADRLLMERDPHAVVEGTALAAFAIGAQEAHIVVRAGATDAAARLRAAIAAAEREGLLGADAGGSGRELRIDVRELTGSFVAGEETVLLRALESRRAQPDQRPPYPAERGLWGRPTVVNNVKTLAAVPWIVRNGAGAFASLGHPDVPGTTLVQLGGAVRRPGVVEVPTGTPLRAILDGPGGGAEGELKAVLVGGPSGGFLAPDLLDTPLLPAPLAAAGAIGGSGAILAVGAGTCLVELAAVMTRYLSDEACGKTIPCRIGTRRMAELGDAFCSGRARPSDATLLGDLAADIRDAALCGLEATAPAPLLTGMRYFASEFEDHIVRGSCPVGTCQPLRMPPAKTGPSGRRRAATGTSRSRGNDADR
jgi:NADH:ubiquinone oxidoreductase subunit F (NADH-binding)